MKRRSVLFGAAASGAVLSAGGVAGAAESTYEGVVAVYDWESRVSDAGVGYAIHARDATIVIGPKPTGFWGLAFFYVKAECTSRVVVLTPNARSILHLSPGSVASIDYFDGNVETPSVKPTLETEVLTGAVLEWARGDFTDGTPKKWIEVR